MESPSWQPDPEVKAELEAMGGYSAAIPDVSVSETPKRKKKRKSSTHAKKISKSVESPSTSTSSAVDQTELINVIKQPAFTSEEKYKVLEARDKLIRLKTKKNTDITSAKHIVGTCPDMCPEKERLMREVQHQVCVYEQEPGEKTMNPSLAVKQYSRSSADQEVPLPHELRPVSVLQRTMAYLLHKIVDLCENTDANVSEWYHFLWDRTRGIRKDITQQELCCQGSVELVEQCARFHIHCSARLVAEDPSVFDQKINTENLTKCLQTLKYMYHDLELKNESCPNEAEFRAYVILLNLNDANFMWEVQQLRTEIQKSKELHFALQVYSALDKNNYVRFFKLVRSTTYLNACILLRYFIQVRLQALTTLIKSHSPRSPLTQFPLTKIEEMLAFEGIASTIDFVEYHGLQLNDTRTHVILERRMFQMPDIPYMLDRAMNVIECKRKCSVGECICGKPLVEINFEEFIPHNSFDDGGFVSVSDYLPDIDLIKLRKEEKIIKVDDRSSDSFLKNAPPVFQKRILTLKNASDSRSNSPMDTTDRSLEAKSEPTPFWNKPEQKSMVNFFDTKSDSQHSIFKMPTQETSVQNFFSKSFIGDTKPIIFGNATQSNLIFGKPQSDKPIEFNTPSQEVPKPIQFPIFTQDVAKSIQFPISSQETQKSIQYPISTQAVSTSIPIFTQDTQKAKQSRRVDPRLVKPTPFNKPIEFQSAAQEIPKPEQSQIFKPIQIANPIQEYPRTEQKEMDIPKNVQPQTGGFFFNLQTTAPSASQFPNQMLTFPQQSQKLKIQEKSLEIAENLKMLNEKIKANEEKADRIKQRLEEEKQQKLLAEKLEIERRNMEEAFKRKLREEAARKKEQERLEEERRRIERDKELEMMRRKAREIEEQRRRELEKDVSSVMSNLIEKVEENVFNEKLRNISQKIKLRKAARYFEKWKHSVLINKRKRKAIDQWPIWVSWTTPDQEAVQLRAKHQDEALKYMKRYKGGFSLEVDLDKVINIEQIDLPQITHKILSKNLHDSFNKSQHNFWKIDIFIASLSYMTPNLKWIDKIIAELFDWKDQSSILIEESRISSDKITYCVKKLDGYKHEDTNGYIFIGDDFCKEFYDDISKILKGSKHMEVPIVILLQNGDYDNEKLTDLCQEYSTGYKVLNQRYTPEILASFVRDGLIFLAQNVSKIPPLELDTLKSFLYKNLATEIWKRMTSFTKWSQPYKTCLRNPKVVIDLYNEAVLRLEKIVFDENSLNYTNFPEIFQNYIDKETLPVLPCDYRYFPTFWKNDSYRRKLKRVFNELHLPQFETKWPPDDFTALESTIQKFGAKFFKENAQKRSYKIIARILKSFDHTNDFDEIKNVLWTDIIEVLIVEKLKEIDFALREPFVTVFDELFVVYDRNTLNDYTKSMWFYINNPVIEKHLNIDEYNENTEAEEEEEEIIFEEAEVSIIEKIDFESSYLEIAEERYDREERLNASKNDLKEFEELMADLEQSINYQKQISKHFDETLTRALHNV